MRRRAFIVGALLVACKKESRCKLCGMRIDMTSPWRTELVGEGGAVTPFDTPKCAFTSWRSGATPAKTLRAQDYYDRQWKTGEELRFVLGGDVLGPMGPDLVPVAPAQASKFIKDHAADRALRLDEVTAAVTSAL